MNEGSIREIFERLKSTGEQALAFDAFVFRRAFGVYYSVWALSIALFISFPLIISYLVPEDVQVFAYPLFYSLVGVLATLYTTKVFSKARGIIRFRKAVKGLDLGEKRRNWRYYYVWAMIVLVMILFSVSFNSVLRFVLLFIFLVAFDFYIYHILKASFGKVPVEGLLATYVYGFSAFSSFFIGIILRHYLFFEILWIPTIVVWFLASLYSLYRAPEDLVRIHGA